MTEITFESIKPHLTDVERKFAPEQLFYKGDIALLTSQRRVSVVGSRKVSPEGLQRTAAVVKKLVAHQITVVSGMAEGVDTCAHATTMNQAGSTIAVIGTPINQSYPKSNADLMERMASEHLVISQFPIGYPVNAKNFPMRNRTMALVSDATIIIEASEKSGTRHQGWEALRLGRRLFILESVVSQANIGWAKEMMDYGAELLTRENIEDKLYDIPFLTSTETVSFS